MACPRQKALLQGAALHVYEGPAQRQRQLEMRLDQLPYLQSHHSRRHLLHGQQPCPHLLAGGGMQPGGPTEEPGKGLPVCVARLHPDSIPQPLQRAQHLLRLGLPVYLQARELPSPYVMNPIRNRPRR